MEVQRRSQKDIKVLEECQQDIVVEQQKRAQDLVEKQPKVVEVHLQAEEAALQHLQKYVQDLEQKYTVIKEQQRYLQQCTQEILLNYANVVSYLVKTLKHSGVQVSTIRDVIAAHHSHSCAKLCDETTDMTKLFQLLDRKGCLTFFNHTLLEKITTWLGDGSCELRLKQFKGKFQSYCRNRVAEIPRSGWSKLGLECESESNEMVEIVFKIDECFETLSIKRLATFEEHVGRALGVEKRALHLKSVQSGCIRVSFLLPVVDLNIEKLYSLLLNNTHRERKVKILSMEIIINRHLLKDCKYIQTIKHPNSLDKGCSPNKTQTLKCCDEESFGEDFVHVC